MTRPNGGMGKAAALVLPVLATVLLAFVDPMPLRALRDIVFDGYQRIMPRPFDPRSAVRIVEIDDESIARLGQWPWPRDLLATVVDRIAEAGPAAIGLDILMAEPDRWSFEQLLNHIPAVPERDAFARAVAQIHR